MALQGPQVIITSIFYPYIKTLSPECNMGSDSIYSYFKTEHEARTGLSNNGKLACAGCLVSLVDFNFLPCLVDCESPSPQSHSTYTLCSYTWRKISVQRPEKPGRLLLIYRLHSQASQGLPRSTLETHKPRFRPKQSPALFSLSFLPFTSFRDFLLIHCSPVAGLQSLQPRRKLSLAVS